MTTDEIQKLKTNLPKGYRKELKEACKCSIAMIDKSLSQKGSDTPIAMLIRETAIAMAEDHKKKLNGFSEKIKQL